jgi:hypothetical protein
LTRPPILARIFPSILIWAPGSKSLLTCAFATIASPALLASLAHRSLRPLSAKSPLRPVLSASSWRALKTAPAAFRSSTLRPGIRQSGIDCLIVTRILRFLWTKLTLGGLTQVLHFFQIELAHLAGLKIKHKRTIADAPNLLHEVPDLFEHFAQLAVASLDQHHFVPWVVALAYLPDACRRRVHLPGSRPFPVNRHAFAQTVEVVLGGIPADFHKIGLFDPRCGPGQFVCQLAIVCHQKQSLAQVVEATHGVKSLAHLFKELHHRGATLGIADGGYEALRLIQNEVAHPLCSLQQLSIHADVVACCVRLAAEFRHNGAVYLHAALRNQFLGMAPTGDPRLRKDLL